MRKWKFIGSGARPVRFAWAKKKGVTLSVEHGVGKPQKWFGRADDETEVTPPPPVPARNPGSCIRTNP